MEKEIGTIQLTKDSAMFICNQASKNILEYRKMLEEARVINWQNIFNKEGLIYKIKKFFGNKTPKLDYSETISKLKTLSEKWKRKNSWSFNNPYYYKSYKWSEIEDQMDEIRNVCKSGDTLKIVTINISIWDNVLFLSQRTKEDLDKILKTDL